MSDGTDFEYFKEENGLSEIESRLILESTTVSPFNYKENARLYAPLGLPFPDNKDEKYIEMISKEIYIQAKNLQKHLGEKGLRTAGTEYYKNLLSYMCLEDKDQMCRFGQKSCVKEINRCLLQKNIGIIESGKKKKFNNFMFSLFSKEYNFKNNPEYCKKYTFDTDVYLYSSKVIDLIVTEVAKNPMGIIDALIEKHKRISSATT